VLEGRRGFQAKGRAGGWEHIGRAYKRTGGVRGDDRDGGLDPGAISGALWLLLERQVSSEAICRCIRTFAVLAS
jgi:hypothetical protein